MFIQSNIEAMQTHLNLGRIDRRFNTSLAKLSTGLELPKPSYGGGKFAVANDMEALYQEYTTGVANIGDALGYLEVAQTAMMEVNEKLLEMNDLAHRARSETLNDDQRQELNAAYRQMYADITEIIIDTRYNDLRVWLFGLGQNRDVVFGEDALFVVNTPTITPISLRFNGTSIATIAAASVAISAMGTAVNTISQRLAEMGAQIDKVQAKANIVAEQAVQQKAMEARINELDFAKEMKNFTSLQVVLQASNAMVAQANMKAQMVLQQFS